MAHIHLSLPDDMAEQMMAKLPGLNVSSILQDALRGLLGCEHRQLACAACRAAVDRAELSREALAGFYRELMWQVGGLVESHVGTAEGAARILKRVGLAHGVTIAEHVPLPRPSRSTFDAHVERHWEAGQGWVVDRRWEEPDEHPIA